jgi:hypothetical protein
MVVTQTLIEVQLQARALAHDVASTVAVMNIPLSALEAM